MKVYSIDMYECGNIYTIDIEYHYTGGLHEKTWKHGRYTHQYLGFVTVPVGLESHNVS